MGRHGMDSGEIGVASGGEGWEMAGVREWNGR